MKLKHKIYVVTGGEYDDYRLFGVFSNVEKAELMRQLCAADNIEEYVLDEIPEHPEGKLRWCVSLLEDGSCIEVEQCHYQSGEQWDWMPIAGYRGANFCRIYIWAADKDEARKLAQERRAALVTSHEWTVNVDEWYKAHTKL